MVLKVKLYGSGTKDDPYVCKLPTYQLIHGDITEGWALVSVPDSVVGLLSADVAAESKTETTSGTHVRTLSAANALKLQTALNASYPQPAGTFKVELQ